MNRGRTIRRITIALTLGAIVGVLVSWAVMFRDFKDAVSTTLVPGDWPIAVPSTWPAKPDKAQQFSDATRSVLSIERNRPTWIRASSAGKSAIWYHIMVESLGWPFHGLKRAIGNTQVDLGVFWEGVPIPVSWQGMLPDSIDTIPIMPAWPGFLLNTLFYGLLIYAARTGHVARKRRLRRQRGLCTQCAYPLTGLNRCPECGTEVRSAAKMPATPTEPVGSTPI